MTNKGEAPFLDFAVWLIDVLVRTVYYTALAIGYVVVGTVWLVCEILGWFLHSPNQPTPKRKGRRK
ncbi:MAG: hypothetical protein WAS94_03520 [Candidatus Saccharimonadales bacterium]